MDQDLLDAEPLAEVKIKDRFSQVILYLCLVIYPIELVMGYKHITFDYSTTSGDTIFSPAYGPFYSLIVLFTIPLGLLTSLSSYLTLEKGRLDSMAKFLLISPLIQLLIILAILFLL